jgi:hypothetical protein
MSSITIPTKNMHHNMQNQCNHKKLQSSKHAACQSLSCQQRLYLFTVCVLKKILKIIFSDAHGSILYLALSHFVMIHDPSVISEKMIITYVSLSEFYHAVKNCIKNIKKNKRNNIDDWNGLLTLLILPSQFLYRLCLGFAWVSLKMLIVISFLKITGQYTHQPLVDENRSSVEKGLLGMAFLALLNELYNLFMYLANKKYYYVTQSDSSDTKYGFKKKKYKIKSQFFKTQQIREERISLKNFLF